MICRRFCSNPGRSPRKPLPLGCLLDGGAHALAPMKPLAPRALLLSRVNGAVKTASPRALFISTLNRSRIELGSTESLFLQPPTRKVRRRALNTRKKANTDRTLKTGNPSTENQTSSPALESPDTAA